MKFLPAKPLTRFDREAQQALCQDIIDVLYVHGFTRSDIRLFIMSSTGQDEAMAGLLLDWMDNLDWSHQRQSSSKL